MQQNEDWIFSFNSSRHNQQFRFVQEKATCDNVGKYEITIEYRSGNARYLDLIVNIGKSSRLIPVINECSNNDKKNSSTITANAIIPAAWFTGNQTISCVPLMTDPELAANLTSTTGIPVCEGYDCEPNCKDDPQGIAYYGDKHFCSIFYQCSNGDMILQNCSAPTYWSHNVCNCVHFDNTICDRTTLRFIF
ncbi:unnamed protein product [Mytilus edulis]|uniref:Chitin-binding type-2 domain-containing protein n=1 Tax=Mytilus edulis TaxID=6550 RepID=A0A8S3SUZ9_MYTED|nr:unnamed protein product [Mytilus edulis]